MPSLLFNYPTATTNTIGIGNVSKKVIIRIPDAYLWSTKLNLKKVIDV